MLSKVRGILVLAFYKSATLFYKTYVTVFAGPWIVARFCAAWEEYQKDFAYRERLTNFGFTCAFERFFNSGFEQNYCLKMRFAKEPWLKWRIRLAPWSFEIPAVLETASRSGIFDDIKVR